jgi:hypothetical protein
MSELSDAQAIAETRRNAMVATAGELHDKAMPLVIALHDGLVAVERAKRRSERIAGDALDAIKEPKTISAVVAVVAALLSFSLFKRFGKKGDEEK